MVSATKLSDQDLSIWICENVLGWKYTRELYIDPPDKMAWVTQRPDGVKLFDDGKCYEPCTNDLNVAVEALWTANKIVFDRPDSRALVLGDNELGFMINSSSASYENPARKICLAIHEAMEGDDEVDRLRGYLADTTNAFDVYEFKYKTVKEQRGRLAKALRDIAEDRLEDHVYYRSFHSSTRFKYIAEAALKELNSE